MTDDETIESEHCKEVFASYGAAMHTAQVLEHGIVNAMVVVRMPERDRISLQDIDKLMAERFEKTLGTLIRLIKSEVICPDDLQKLLTDALAERNFLAHRFFRERNDDFFTVNGRDNMITELQHDIALFNRADSLLGDVVRPIRERFGVTDDRIEALMDEMTRELTDRVL